MYNIILFNLYINHSMSITKDNYLYTCKNIFLKKQKTVQLHSTLFNVINVPFFLSVLSILTAAVDLYSGVFLVYFPLLQPV